MKILLLKSTAAIGERHDHLLCTAGNAAGHGASAGFSCEIRRPATLRPLQDSGGKSHLHVEKQMKLASYTKNS